MTDTKVQRFKFTIPIIKTSVKIVKDEKGNEIEERYVEGVASGTELDKHGDRMAPSAIESMAKSLKQHVIALNAEHDTSWLGELGDIDKLEVTENNDLGIKAKLNEMSSAKDLWYALREQNKKLGLSIGGYVKDYEMVKEGEGDKAKWVRLYKEIDLDHIAVTSRPAYPKAWVSVISKSIESNADNKLILKKEMEEIQKPYPNEHACRLKSPGQYDTCRRGTRSHNGKGYSVVYCKKTGGKMEEQSYRYNKETWSASEAGSHCRSHGGTFEAARRGEKSLEEKSRQSQRDKKLRELARKIVKRIQEMEADLLLELTYTGLQFCDKELLLIIERSLSVAKKKVSLETEEAKKKADSKKSEPEDKKDETLVTPEDEKPKEEEAKDKEEKEEESEEKTSKDKTSDEPKSEESESGESGEKESKKKGEKEGEESDDEEEPESGKDKEKTSEKESEEKSTDADKTELLKAVQEMSEGLKKVLESNEVLTERVKELEGQPAGRKTVEIKKNVGDEEGSDKTAKELIKERDEKIEEAREKHANDPNLFARLQRIRFEYSQKAQE